MAILDGPLRFEPNTDRRYDIRGRLAAGGALFTTESVPSGIAAMVNSLIEAEIRLAA